MSLPRTWYSRTPARGAPISSAVPRSMAWEYGKKDWYALYSLFKGQDLFWTHAVGHQPWWALVLHLLQLEQVKDIYKLRLGQISLQCYQSAQGQALCRQRSGQLPSAVTVKGHFATAWRQHFIPTDQPRQKQFTMDFWSEALVTFYCFGFCFHGKWARDSHLTSPHILVSCPLIHSCESWAAIQLALYIIGSSSLQDPSWQSSVLYAK